jgi:hypothetical protein
MAALGPPLYVHPSLFCCNMMNIADALTKRQQ